MRSDPRISEYEKNATVYLEAIFEHSGESMVVLDNELQLLRFNQASVNRCERFFGKPPQQGKPYENYIFKDTRPKFRYAARQALSGLRSFYELKTHIDGVEIEIHTTIVPIEDEDGLVSKIVVLSEHRTREDVLEQALNFSEDRFKSIINDQTEMIVRWKPGGVRTFVNKAYCKEFGIREEEALGTSFFDLVADKDVMEVRKRINLLTPESPVHTSTHRVKYPGGRLGWQEWTDRAFFDSGGNVMEYQSVGRDVTELYESNALFQDMLDKALVGVFIIDHERVIHGNAQLSEMFGYPDSGLRNILIEELVHPNYRDFVLGQIGERLKGIAITKPYHFKGVKKDGEQIWVEAIGRKTKYKGKDAVIGTIQDITEVRSNMIALEESRANLSTILENTKIIYLLVNLDFELLSYNKAAVDYASGEFDPAKSGPNRKYLLNSFIRPKRKKVFDNYINRARNGETINYIIEDRGQAKIWFDVNIIPVKSKDEVVALVISAEDITVKRKNEEELRKQIELLKELSFITSHELRHEYTKLHGLVDLISRSDGQADFIKDLLKECQTTFQNLNESIYKLNNRINFSQGYVMGETQEVIRVNQVILLDDDPIMNTIHSKLLEDQVKPKLITAFTNVDDTVSYIKEHGDQKFFVLLDINMPDKDGWDFLRESADCENLKAVCILSSSIDSQDRFKAQRYKKVIEFISKPLTNELVKQLMELVHVGKNV